VWAQFVVFANPAALPALESVVLLGDWATPIFDNGVSPLRACLGELEENLGARSCRLEVVC
jgi:hypothetical protein